jgi:hypothetical protein
MRMMEALRSIPGYWIICVGEGDNAIQNQGRVGWRHHGRQLWCGEALSQLDMRKLHSKEENHVFFNLGDANDNRQFEK